MSGLQEAFPTKVMAKNIDATIPENVEIVKGLGFKRHGLVVRAPDGKVLLKQPDHSVDVQAVREALTTLFPS